MAEAVTGIPMTPAQQGLWFAERAIGAAAAYLVPAVVTAPDAVEPAALDKAWAALTDRHPLLAAAVAESAGEPLLLAGEAAPVVHREVGADELRTVLAAELATGFDFADSAGPVGPFARCTALKVDDGRTVVMVVAHHLVLDGLGRDMLVADLGAAVAGQPLGPGSLDRFAGFARAQAERVAAVLPAAREFWAARPTPPAEVLLPGLAATPTAAEDATHIDLAWDAELDAALTAGAAALGATRFEVLLAGVHALLARYGNTAGSVAVDVSTRRPETAGEMGMWVNELPVTLGADLERPFGRLVRDVRAEAREVYGHREVPFGRAVAGLPPRLAMAPVSTSYIRLRTDSPGQDASPVERLFATATVRAAMHLHFIDTPDGLTGRVHVPTRLLPAADAERVIGHLRTLLAAGLAEPDRPLGDLDLLLPAELALLERINDTARPRPATTVLDLVRAAAYAAPDAVAVSGDGGSRTYRDLVAAAHRIGHGLRRRGVGSGDVVGLCAHRNVELVAGLLGVLAAGAAYLPLDPTAPAARLGFIAADAGTKLVLGHAEAMAGLGEQSVELLALDGLAAFAAEPETPPAATDPDGLAYVIYTSGSTGRPKGVEVGHAALANIVAAIGELVGSDPADRWLNLTTLSFDISGLELFAPLTTGGRVVVAADAAVREGAALARLVADAGITHVQATPSSWQLLLDAGWTGAPVTALCGGEALPLPLARRLRPLVDRMVNVYGPTETTVWSTAAEIPADPDRVTIGGPLANTTLQVLDARLRPVPAGVPGELCIGGAGLARGYRGRPELTAERFVTDPAGRRLYRSGDLVRLGADGQFDFLGRADDQIKLRGHRIELGEIERTLLDAPGVAQAAVAVRDGELAAYLVATVGADASGDVAAVRAYVADRLPRYMIPRDFRLLDELPRTFNGKLDRAALPAPGAAAEPGVVAAPGAAVEGGGPAAGEDADLTAVVTGIWAEVLRVDDFAPGVTLFDLGGHSLTIMQIIARIRERLGVEVPFDAFFDTPTIDGVVSAVDELRQEEPE
ncbi:amino acid adenylation domain-containing protein [Streptomyces cocklensis]|uniref:Amino acid adenylation domain-containing protein n=1 Tax=Actinacidiphila cocklensis TaxID=887465 RepID=A0A9W4DXA7_9ACTN|nr:amino acid adenylation domain-containing protein [Actinacidiphila cocklensis]MDD1057425.1 amino acid adenylation domain-containing protein [Actinacidiphila cocklensis]CAG6399285.1 Amino acid adenylation domain-containing protein [Actinacidiphila cocklensis]